MIIKKWFDKDGNILKKIPTKAIKESSASGGVTERVEYWREKLNFVCPREIAIDYLQEFGAWA